MVFGNESELVFVGKFKDLIDQLETLEYGQNDSVFAMSCETVDGQIAFDSINLSNN